MQTRTGQIFWLDGCPPLEGDIAKRRPVIVISPPDRLKTDAPVLVVATSTSVLESEADRIKLPSLADQPQTKTGLPKSCWAYRDGICSLTATAWSSLLDMLVAPF